MSANYNYAMFQYGQDNGRSHSPQGYGHQSVDRSISLRASSQYQTSQNSGYAWPSYQAQQQQQQHHQPANTAAYRAPAQQSNSLQSQHSASNHSGRNSASLGASHTTTANSYSDYGRSEYQTTGLGGYNSSASHSHVGQASSAGASAYQATQLQYRTTDDQSQHQHHRTYSGNYGKQPYAQPVTQTLSNARQTAKTPPTVEHHAAPRYPDNASQQQYGPPAQQYLDRSASAQNHQPNQSEHVSSRSANSNTSLTQESVPQDTISHSSTVDPAQVYDPRHEYERMAARRAEQAANRSQEPAPNTAAASTAPAKSAVPETNNGSTTAGHSDGVAAAKKLSKEGAKPKRSRKSGGAEASKTKAARSKATSAADDMTAALTLMQTANSSNPNTTTAEKKALEDQMMEMFKKMREFNQQDPDMLARLWNQERTQHLAQSAEPGSSATASPSQTSSTPTGAKKRGPKPGAKAAKKAAAAAASAAGAAAGAGNETAGAAAGAGNETAGGAAASTFAAIRGTPNAAPVASSQPPAAVLQVSPVVTTNATPKPLQMPTASGSGAKVVVGTIWPPEKKGTLAQAAVTFIKDDARNAGKTLFATDIAAILDTNPRYVELCEAIEAKGFKVERAAFAKYLLKAVPGRKGANAQQEKGATSAGASAGRADSIPITSPTDGVRGPGLASSSVPPAATAATAANTAKSTKKTSPAKQKATSSAAATVDPTLEGLDAVKAFVDNPESATPTAAKPKAKVSRKKSQGRTDNDASSTPQPQSKEELARKRAFGDLVDLTVMSQSEDEDEIYFPPAKRQDQGTTHDAGLALPSPPSTDADNGDSTAKRPAVLDVNNLAPRATAAPDISAILNASQPASTPQASKADSAAPGPPIPQVDGAGRSPPHAAAANTPKDPPRRGEILALGIDKSKAFRRSEYDARTIARDVLLACGRHPHLRPLNHYLERLKEVFPALRDNNSDLSTINWAVIDPGGPTPGSGAKVQPSISLDFGDEADDEDEDGTSSAVVKDSKAQRSKAPLGRPPSHFGKTQTPAGSKSRPPGTPQSGTPGSGGGYSAFKRFDEHGNEIKKKGRPVGWRKWMQKTPGGGDSSGKSPAVAKSKKPEPQPIYHEYKCEWRSCAARLHNLDTLRRHIHKVHGKRDEHGKLYCHWASCGLGAARVFESANVELWKDHIERAHLSPIAWKYGDGPTAGVSDMDSELSEAYMSDRQGRRVTPQIFMPEERMPEPPRRHKRTAEQEAQREVDEAARRKRDAGPSVDKTGARFANEKRRQGLIDDATDAHMTDDDDDD